MTAVLASVLAAVAAATAVLAAVPARVRVGAGIAAAARPAERPGEGAGERPGERAALLLRLRIPLVALTVVGAMSVVGGASGVVLGAGAGVLGWRVLGAVEDPASVRRRAALARDLPMAVHLLGASLRAGVAVGRALADVAVAVQGPVAEELGLVVRRLDLGLEPAAAWAGVDPALAPLGRSLARAAQSGASVVVVVDRVAEELRSGQQHRSAELARTVEVRAAAPLGICFLPAFVLLGVVPMVVGIFSSMDLFG